MIDQKSFFDKYKITNETYDKTGFVWEDLEAIYTDYQSKQKDLLVIGNMIAEHLQQINEVHSLKIRIKEPEHLIEKIIRKKSKEPSREITLENYQNEITDLIGVKGLHLFKDDWVSIHAAICQTWELKECPKANIRKGDAEEAFVANNCEIVEHPHGYRSVHYLITSKPTKKSIIFAEIQIRTLFEEGWSEIDHRLRYPYDVDNVLISAYLAIFNRLAGNADEMGTFIKSLKIETENYQKRLAAQKQELDEKIQELENLKESVQIKDAEKKRLQDVIDSLKKSNKSGASLVDGLTSANLLPAYMSNDPLKISMKCRSCGKHFPSITSSVGHICDIADLALTKCQICGKHFSSVTSKMAHICGIS
jgi:ppGpp synthetase/RelA/SpoT-type nucleotidyltranferase